MITSIEYIQLKAFARQDGALLALLWVFTSVLYIIGMTNQLIGLAATMLIIYTPFFVGGRLRNFRDYGREGLISFRRGYAYTVFVFFYAGVLFAIAMYLYLTFMDNGYLMSQMSKVLTSDEAQQAMEADGADPPHRLRAGYADGEYYTGFHTWCSHQSDHAAHCVKK